MVVLDHVAFGARDREAAADAVEALGFTPSAPSRCDWESSGSHYSADATCVVFPHQYLDFIQISNPRWDEHLASSSVYARGTAPTGVVLSGIELEPAYARIAGGDPPQLEPYPIMRRVEADPPFDIAYRFLPLERLGLPLGLISDSSPQALRRPDWLLHPNTAIGIATVHLRVPSVREGASRLAQEPLSLRSTTGLPEVVVGAARIRLHEEPSEGYLRTVSQLLPRLENPTLLALEFHVASIEAAARILVSGAVRFTKALGTLEIDPDQGFGTGILFREGSVSGG